MCSPLQNLVGLVTSPPVLGIYAIECYTRVLAYLHVVIISNEPREDFFDTFVSDDCLQYCHNAAVYIQWSPACYNIFQYQPVSNGKTICRVSSYSKLQLYFYFSIFFAF